MSLRRKSCQACFKGKRKCDYTRPTCARCSRTGKRCHYAYLPTDLETLISAESLETRTTGTLSPLSNSTVLQSPETTRTISRGSFGRVYTNPLLANAVASTSSLERSLGVIPSLSAYHPGCDWVADQVKSYPTSFAYNGETVFIHKQLFGDALPKMLRTAFGICGAAAFLNDRNESVIFGAIDAEVAEMVQSSDLTLMDDLSRLQALLLYQLIRLARSDLKQQIIAEQQEELVLGYGYQLLERAKDVIQDDSTWEAWILGESIRRTVVIAFLLYSKWFCRNDGYCRLISALRVLPVTYNPSIWNSKKGMISASEEQPETMPFERFSALWLASPRRVDPFQKVVLIACQGRERVEPYSES